MLILKGKIIGWNYGVCCGFLYYNSRFTVKNLYLILRIFTRFFNKKKGQQSCPFKIY